MEGIGEKISFIALKKNLDIGIVLINPCIELSTKEVFSQYVPKHEKILEKKILKVDFLQDFLEIVQIGNDLEKTAIKIVPEIKLILSLFKKSDNCLNFGMSGSGPTCYGIFANKKIAMEFKDNILLSKKIKNFWVWAGGVLSRAKQDLILPIKYN